MQYIEHAVSAHATAFSCLHEKLLKGGSTEIFSRDCACRRVSSESVYTSVDGFSRCQVALMQAAAVSGGGGAGGRARRAATGAAPARRPAREFQRPPFQRQMVLNPAGRSRRGMVDCGCSRTIVQHILHFDAPRLLHPERQLIPPSLRHSRRSPRNQFLVPTSSASFWASISSS